MHPCAGEMGEKNWSPQLASVCLVFKINSLHTALVTHVVMGQVWGLDVFVARAIISLGIFISLLWDVPITRVGLGGL